MKALVRLACCAGLAFIAAGVQAGPRLDKKPVPVRFDQVQIQGDLLLRATKNFDRLETDIYYPQNVFPEHHHPTSADWPGDKEGRTMLGLILEAQATHRTPVYLEEMMRILPQKLNKMGYLGRVQHDTIDEQQLSGHGWLLRALCEYYIWKKDARVKTYIDGIIQNLALPTAGHHRDYPINPSERVAGTGGMSGSSANVVKGWKLSTDVGCDFIFMDGVVQAYGLFPSAPLKSLIDEMMNRFLEMDLIGIKAQTHATLTGLRALLRYAEITGRKELIPEAEKRFKLYWNRGISENYENYNWFERPEWTEPCAIVDSYLVAIQLWQYTRNPEYLENAQLIYYNALSHTQRANGGFGCDNCPGPHESFISVKAEEAFWCCTMRGGEGLAKAVQYSYFMQGDTLIVPSFYPGSLHLDQKNLKMRIHQETKYPFGNQVVLRFDELKSPQHIVLQFFQPGWVLQPRITVNQKPVSFITRNKFVELSIQLKQNDVVEYSFELKSGVEPVSNRVHTSSQNVRLAYGPLLLGYEGETDLTIPSNAKLVAGPHGNFFIAGTSTSFSPVYHLLDGKVTRPGYRKQILFKTEH